MLAAQAVYPRDHVGRPSSTSSFRARSTLRLSIAYAGILATTSLNVRRFPLLAGLSHSTKPIAASESRT